MKSFPKILTISFLTIFIFQLACLLALTLAPQVSQAADPAVFKPQIEIPDPEKEFSKDPKTGGYILPSDTGGIAKYIRAIYKYAIGIVGILAAVVLMVGGVMWIMAGGSATMIGEAKAWIGASLTGLTLALLSYLILATVNPALVELRTTAIKKVGPTIETNFDISIPCGQQVQGQNRICGSLCPTGQKCEKVPEGIVGAIKCPKTLSGSGPNTGSGDYYLCSSLSSGGTNCCDNNNDNQCLSGSGYVCNMQINAGACPGKGTCALKQGSNGICGEDNDCVSNNCDTGFLATYRCK